MRVIAVASIAVYLMLVAGPASATARLPSRSVWEGAASVPFPDVPPWHWAHDAVQKDQDAGLVIGYPASPAELAATAVTQVYDGFAHAAAPGAQEWVERFTYNRPPDWPAPLQRAQVARFALTGMALALSQETGTATFRAAVTTRAGRTVTSPMRVPLRFNGQDWQADYAALAAASPIFR
jgi:hypothetical protein